MKNHIFEMPVKVDTDKFIKRAQEIPSNKEKYDYSQVNYVNSQTPVTIICKKHGPFSQMPSQHLYGYGCPKCKFDKIRKTKESWLDNVFKRHPENKEKYDYSQVNYVNSQTPVTIICKKHGPFPQRPNSHLRGDGCPECGDDKVRGTKESWLDNVFKRHPENKEKYDYSQVNYVNSQTPVTIICKKHGPISQPPSAHLFGYGCQKCAIDNVTKNKESWLDNVFKRHPENKEKYDYSQVKYIKATTPVTIICKKHGPFSQPPYVHLRGSGCSECGDDKVRRTKESWLDNVFKRHPENKEKYDYSQVKYIKATTPVTIICKKHGPFPQRPNSHLRGSGCPECSESKGERLIFNILKNNNIKNERQKTFKDCTNRLLGRYCRQLKFDFYLPDLNTVIEYDGRQHYEPIDFFGGDAAFNKLKLNDKLKNEYCEKNNIKMIRIPHEVKNDEIESYILSRLKKTVRLTESELVSLIKSIIKEQYYYGY